MDYITVNKNAWDKRTGVHVDSKFYDVAGFLAGQSSLPPIDLQQVGEVAGKSLLHLQCHFGLDTLSWARLGAEVTGVDLSSEAINQAQVLAQKAKLSANFLNQDVYTFGKLNQQQFDIIYTSYGVLSWLPDLDAWAKTVAGALKPGGQFNLIEFHAFNDLLSGYSYFPQSVPDVEDEGTYTENCGGEKSTMMTWGHSLSEVIEALISVGINIEGFREYPYSPYNCFADLEYVAGAGYQLLYKGQQVPLVYAIKGRKVG